MNFLRRALTALIATAAFAAHAQDYPSKPVRIVVPYAAGGGVDAAARLLAQHLTGALGQNFVVDPKPGGGTVLGAEMVARAAPDGYTFLLTGGSTMSLLPMTHQGKLPYDPLKDFAPVAMVSRLPFFLVTSAEQPWKSVKDMVDEARAKQGALAYASNGVGATAHLGTELLLQQAGVKMVHVPYNGFAPAVADLVTQRVGVVLVDVAPVKGQLDAKKLRALAVASPQRSRFLPDVPTLAEAGFPGAEVEVWLALYAPAGTPQNVVAKVGAEAARFLATPEAREAYGKLGHETDTGGADVVRNRIAAEQKAFAPVVKATGLDRKP